MHLIQRLSDVSDPSSLSNRMRSKRFRLFERLTDPLPRPLRIVDLGADTLYYYRVRSSDVSGNNTTSATLTFRTRATQDSGKPVIVAGPSLLGRTATAATIRWRTNKPTDYVIEYGNTADFGEIVESQT